MSAARGRVREVVLLAWPAALSFLSNNLYRINDQVWIQSLGPEAQSAFGALTFVQIANFAFVFLSAGGALALVSRAVGAKRPDRARVVAAHALLLGVAIVGVLSLVGPRIAGAICELLGLEGASLHHGEAYLATIYAVLVPLALAAILDHVFIGFGNTRIPMMLQLLAVSLNFVLNPLLVYGRGAEAANAGSWLEGPLTAGVAALGDTLGIEGRGMAGAALATGLSRVVTVSLGILILARKYGVRAPRPSELESSLALRIVKIGVPVSLGIALYSGTYWALLSLVLARLDEVVKAGLGVGFQVFEGVAFPLYFGVSMACATLVGQSLGAGDPERARQYIRGARDVGRILAGLTTLAFLFAAPHVAPWFTRDAEVLEETVLYVRILAFSQFFVASQIVSEKALVGAGHTRPIVLITGSGDLLRIPLAAYLALGLELGAAGVWWAINLSTVFKAALLLWVVRRGVWAEAHGLNS